MMILKFIGHTLGLMLMSSLMFCLPVMPTLSRLSELCRTEMYEKMPNI